MAEVVAESASSSSGGVFGGVDRVFAWLGHYWWVIVIFAILIVGMIIAIILIIRSERERKRQNPMYVQFENTLEGCALNRRADWIKKKRRWWLLAVGGVPLSMILCLAYLYIFLGEHWFVFWVLFASGFLVWLPLIFLWVKDYSMRIVNVDSRTVGYYRGHARRMDGYVYFLIKVGFKYLIFERKIVLRIPERVLTTKTVLKKNKETKELEKVEEFERIILDAVVWNERDNYLYIPMTTYYMEGSFYYDATLVQAGKIIDLRQKIERSTHLSQGIHLAEDLYEKLAKVTNNAVDSNVGVSARKKTPEREREVNSGGGQET